MGRYSNSGLSHGTSGSPQQTIDQGNYDRKVNEIARDKMVEPLVKMGVKFKKEDVVFVIKDKTGQTIWLEKGNKGAGLKHILDGAGTSHDLGHADDFKNAFNVERNNVSNFLRDVMTNGEIVSNTIKRVAGNKEGFERKYKYNNNYVVVTGIGLNGFIVSAYPYSED